MMFFWWSEKVIKSGYKIYDVIHQERLRRFCRKPDHIVRQAFYWRCKDGAVLQTIKYYIIQTIVHLHDSNEVKKNLEIKKKN